MSARVSHVLLVSYALADVSKLRDAEDGAEFDPAQLGFSDEDRPDSRELTAALRRAQDNDGNGDDDGARFEKPVVRSSVGLGGSSPAAQQKQRAGADADGDAERSRPQSDDITEAERKEALDAAAEEDVNAYPDEVSPCSTCSTDIVCGCSWITGGGSLVAMRIVCRTSPNEQLRIMDSRKSRTVSHPSLKWRIRTYVTCWHCSIIQTATD